METDAGSFHRRLCLGRPVGMAEETGGDWRSQPAEPSRDHGVWSTRTPSTGGSTIAGLPQHTPHYSTPHNVSTCPAKEGQGRPHRAVMTTRPVSLQSHFPKSHTTTVTHKTKGPMGLVCSFIRSFIHARTTQTSVCRPAADEAALPCPLGVAFHQGTDSSEFV